LSAIATDSGNDALTYQWNFGDNTSPISGQTVSHTYLDNGNYIVTLTVTDSHNSSVTQTIPLSVANLPPIAIAGTDQTRYPNKPLTFNGSYSDPGSLDTHTQSLGAALQDLKPVTFFGEHRMFASGAGALRLRNERSIAASKVTASYFVRASLREALTK
jgi:hypothetical protein